MKIDCPIRFFHPTSDNWHPNFPENTIEIEVYLYYTSIDKNKGMIRISVRGADDTSMERDEILPEAMYQQRLTEIQQWCKDLPKPFTMAWLKENGFEFS